MTDCKIKCNGLFIVNNRAVNRDAAQTHIWQRYLFTLWQLKATKRRPSNVSH